MKKKTLSNKEIREINEHLKKYNFSFEKHSIVEIIEYEKIKVIKCNNETLFFFIGDDIFPSLKMLLEGKMGLKKISVDMGAVKFVVKGADIMRPGITEIGEGILKDEVVEIVDVNNKKPLAIGKALFDSGEMQNLSSGRAVENIHFIGDEIWKI
jgi:PUA-domain protein